MVINKKHLLLFLLFLSKIDVCFSQQVIGPCFGSTVFVTENGQCNNAPYVLVFEDEFSGTSLDKSKWIANVGNHGPLSREKEYYVANNVIVSGNYCYLYTTDVEVTDPNSGEHYPYSSGEIISKYTFGYGLYEINCQVPHKEGLWPAFWARNGNPNNEIDGFEFYDDATKTDPDQKFPRFDDILGTNDCPWGTSPGPLYSSAFHTFDFSFDNYEILWSIDGTPLRYSTKFSDMTSQPILCDNLKIADNPYILSNEFPFPPLGIVANVAVQPSPYSPTSWPDDYVMAIKYIRYYEQIPCSGGTITVNESDLNSASDFFNVFIGTNVTVSGNVSVPKNGALEILASNSIILQSGFTSNGYFVGQINNNPCDGIHRPIKNNGGGNTPSDSTNNNALPKLDKFNFNIFPVPANNSVTISFYLPSQSKVLIEISDILGKQILNVIDEDNLSSGNHQQIINVSNLNSGIYICTIRADKYLEQKKLIVERP